MDGNEPPPDAAWPEYKGLRLCNKKATQATSKAMTIADSDLDGEPDAKKLGLEGEPADEDDSGFGEEANDVVLLDSETDEPTAKTASPGAPRSKAGMSSRLPPSERPAAADRCAKRASRIPPVSVQEMMNVLKKPARAGPMKRPAAALNGDDEVRGEDEGGDMKRPAAASADDPRAEDKAKKRGRGEVDAEWATRHAACLEELPLQCHPADNYHGEHSYHIKSATDAKVEVLLRQRAFRVKCQPRCQ